MADSDDSKSFLEYAGVPPERLYRWMDALRDVELARGHAPPEGRPGHDEHLAKCRQALPLLQPYVDDLEKGPLKDGCRDAIQDGLAKKPRSGSASLALSWCMSGLEAALLGLVGPQGQHPHPQRSIALPNRGDFEAWLVAVTDCPDLVPHARSKQLIGWHTRRAWLSPAQIAALPPTVADLSYEGLRAASTRDGGPASDIEHAAYNRAQKRYREALAELRRDLADYAARGLAYVGWTAWYGYE